jgi:hypothetical protein
MKRALILLLLLPLGCPGGGNSGVEAQDEAETVRSRLIRALDEKNRAFLTRAEVARAWRSVTDEEWDRWDLNNDDVLDRKEIAEITR